MPVTITIPAPLRQFAGGQSQIIVEAKTAGEALDLLTSTHAALRRHLFNDQNVVAQLRQRLSQRRRHSPRFRVPTRRSKTATRS